MRELTSKYERVLVLIDGSDLAKQALAPAAEITVAMPAEIVCLQVVIGLSPDLDPHQK